MLRTRLHLLVTTLILILASVYPMQVNAQVDASLENSQNQLHQLQETQKNLNSTLETTLNTARSLEVQVSDLMYQSIVLQKQIEEKKKQLEERNTQFKERIKVEYQDGDVSFLEVLLDSKDFSDFLDRFTMLTLIAQHDRALIDTLHKENTALIQDQSHLSEQLHEKQKKQEQLVALEQNLQQQLKQNQSQIAMKEHDIYQEIQAENLRQEQERQRGQQPTQLASRGESLIGSQMGPYWEMVATAYTAPSNAQTATGTKVAVGTAAVDPSVIPLGTKLYIEGYGYAVASDTGLDIKGNRIDLFFNSVDQCILFGRRTVKVYRVQ